jgi:hypothetical protein
MPKYVASRSALDPLDCNAEDIEADAVEGVRKLKGGHAGDLVMSGCGELARERIQASLVGERPTDRFASVNEDLRIGLDLGLRIWKAGIVLAASLHSGGPAPVAKLQQETRATSARPGGSGCAY